MTVWHPHRTGARSWEVKLRKVEALVLLVLVLWVSLDV
jgi:hypothetical protein